MAVDFIIGITISVDIELRRNPDSAIDFRLMLPIPGFFKSIYNTSVYSRCWHILLCFLFFLSLIYERVIFI